MNNDIKNRFRITLKFLESLEVPKDRMLKIIDEAELLINFMQTNKLPDFTALTLFTMTLDKTLKNLSDDKDISVMKMMFAAIYSLSNTIAEHENMKTIYARLVNERQD